MNSARHMALHASPMNHFYLHKIQKMFCFCGCPLTNYYGENGAIVSTVGGGTPTSQRSGTRCTPVVPHGRPPPPLAAGRLGGGAPIWGPILHGLTLHRQPWAILVLNRLDWVVQSRLRASYEGAGRRLAVHCCWRRWRSWGGVIKISRGIQKKPKHVAKMPETSQTAIKNL